MGLPSWDVAHLKAKIDTGARTSSLHAFDLEWFDRDGNPWVRFEIHPWQRSTADAVIAEAAVSSTRDIRSSSGAIDHRPVIHAPVTIAGHVVDAEITLDAPRRDGISHADRTRSHPPSFPGRPRRVLPRRPPAQGRPAQEPTATMSVTRRAPFRIGELDVAPGRSGTGELPIARQVTGTRISLPLQVLHGRRDGRTIWLSAAVHGDEINGVEIIRRVMRGLDARTMAGTVVAVPIVNVHGFLNGDRYLPDRRDLNRSFPGSPTGSLAARIANLFMTEIVSRCDVGIDLHTGSDHRTNLPQIRADLDDPETRKLAEAFGAPLMLHAKTRDGSLRGAATERGATVLLFEGGEALRFDDDALTAGVDGIRRVLAELAVIDPDTAGPRPVPVESRSSSWVRARRSGIALLDAELGEVVQRGQQLGLIHDSVGRRLARVSAPRRGVVIGRVQQPLVNQGDALIHLAEVSDETIASLGRFVSTHSQDRL